MMAGMALRPEVLEYTRDHCSLAKAMEVIGERWCLLVLREAFFGVRRFADFQATIGIAKNMLSDRLTKLVAHGLLTKEPYRDDGQRERFEYRLTDQGRELFPVIVALVRWGDRWLAGPQGPPLEIHHRGCGSPLHVEVRCAAGHGDLSLRDADPRPTKAAVRKVRR